jgi:hypothetical protein
MVVSAMKMETAVTAPWAGVVGAIEPTKIGASVAAGQIVATIAPTDGGPVTPRDYGQDTWAPMLAEVHALQAIAHARFAPGSTDPGVVRQRDRGKLTCRERIDLLLDDGSFREVGSLAGFASYDEEGRVADFTPANHVGGWGRIEGRPGVVCADDFTSRGGHSDGSIGAKSGYLDRLSITMRCPSVRFWTARPAAAASPPWCRRRRAAAKAPPRRAPGRSRRGGRASQAAAAPSCPAIWARPCSPNSSATFRWSIFCSAASSASARPRRCLATSR